MPAHIVLAHLAAMVAPIAGVLAVGYALAPSSRRAVRWPLMVFAVASAVLLVMTSNAGHDLLNSLQASGATAEYEAAYRHAKGSDLATVAAVLLVIVAPLAAWRFLTPRTNGRPLAVIARVVLAVVGLGLIAGTGYAVALGLGAVWAA